MYKLSYLFIYIGSKVWVKKNEKYIKIENICESSVAHKNN